jgi:hypothetical protein
VGRSFKEGIWGALGDMDLDRAWRPNEARGNGIAEEVDAVATRGESERELARYDSRAAVCRVAQDTDTENVGG